MSVRKKPPQVKDARKSISVSRHISDKDKILLAVRSGGRCQFHGCNDYLFEHPLTLREGNFSEQAHIFPFSNLGPRGEDGQPPEEINSVNNLMLLCPRCHKLIDTNPKEHPRTQLEGYKREHEARVKRLTSYGPETKSTVVVLKSVIGKDTVSVTIPQICEAIAPRYPSEGVPFSIDLTAIANENLDGFYQLAKVEVERRTQQFYATGMDIHQTGHLSVFGCAPIPLLILLGSLLSNKIPTDFYPRRRRADRICCWDDGDKGCDYTLEKLQIGNNPKNVVLMLSLSGKIHRESLPTEIDGSYSIYEITLKDVALTPDFLKIKEDLEKFRAHYRVAIEEICKSNPTIETIFLFPAIPIPVALACGHDLLPKVHPSLTVYDRISDKFIKRIIINR